MRTALAVALLASVLTAPQAHASVPPCDWRAEFTSTLAQLGEDQANWSVRSQLRTAEGRVAYGLSHWDVTAEISRRTPCRLVRAVVSHEWIHLQQMRVYGLERAMHLYRSASVILERLADCGAELLVRDLRSSRFSVPIRAYTGRTGCRDGELSEARKLIGKKR